TGAARGRAAQLRGTEIDPPVPVAILDVADFGVDLPVHLGDGVGLELFFQIFAALGAVERHLHVLDAFFYFVFAASQERACGQEGEDMPSAILHDVTSVQGALPKAKAVPRAPATSSRILK